MPCSPCQPVSDANWEKHLAAYEALFSEQELVWCTAPTTSSSSSSSSSSAAVDGAPLSGLIRLFTEAADSGDYVQLAWQTAGWMGEAANWPAVQRQLEQPPTLGGPNPAAPTLGGQLPQLLSGTGLLSLAQLRYTCWFLVYDMSAGLVGSCVMAGRGATMHPLQLTPAVAGGAGGGAASGRHAGAAGARQPSQPHVCWRCGNGPRGSRRGCPARAALHPFVAGPAL